MDPAIFDPAIVLRATYRNNKSIPSPALVNTPRITRMRRVLIVLNSLGLGLTPVSGVPDLRPIKTAPNTG